MTITVGGPQAPIVDAAADMAVADTDRNPGETVTLSGSASDPDGTIVSYEWLLGTTSLGTGSTLQARLPNGTNIVTLRVTDNAGLASTDTVQVSVEVPVTRSSLGALPNLDPNQRQMALALDRVCTNLDARDDTGTLDPKQRELLTRCDAIYFNNSVANQVEALDALVPDHFALARTQTLLFANTQYASIMDRLIALRGGARGLSL